MFQVRNCSKTRLSPHKNLPPKSYPAPKSASDSAPPGRRASSQTYISSLSPVRVRVHVRMLSPAHSYRPALETDGA